MSAGCAAAPIRKACEVKATEGNVLARACIKSHNLSCQQLVSRVETLYAKDACVLRHDAVDRVAHPHKQAVRNLHQSLGRKHSQATLPLLPTTHPVVNHSLHVEHVCVLLHDAADAVERLVEGTVGGVVERPAGGTTPCGYIVMRMRASGGLIIEDIRRLELDEDEDYLWSPFLAECHESTAAELSSKGCRSTSHGSDGWWGAP